MQTNISPENFSMTENSLKTRVKKKLSVNTIKEKTTEHSFPVKCHITQEISRIFGEFIDLTIKCEMFRVL